MSTKLSSAYKTIGEVVKILNNEEPKSFKVNTHTLRFWETHFNQLKPKIFNNKRRYYDYTAIEVLKLIKFLLKSEGMTIQGVKKHLNQNNSNLDDSLFNSIRTKYFKNKLSNLKNIIKELKK
jgi:Predicted transcriptional regulators